MNAQSCECDAGSAGSVRRPASRVCRKREIAGCVVPTVLLVLLPKCPACVMAYVALATGVGISFSVARNLRVAMMASCVAPHHQLPSAADSDTR